MPSQLLYLILKLNFFENEDDRIYPFLLEKENPIFILILSQFMMNRDDHF
jgi:hypothetical protein